MTGKTKARTKTRKADEVPRWPLDWAAGHGPVSGAVSAATGCAAVALTGAAAGMPYAWPAVVGAAGALGHGAGALWRGRTLTTVATRAASWLLAGGWCSWAVHTGPLSWTAAGTLAALGVGVGAMASVAAVHEEAAELDAREAERLALLAEQEALLAEAGRERAAIAAAWRERILRCASVDVQILAVELWENGHGFTLDGKLPGGRATWQSLEPGCKSMAGDAELPHGCTVTVSEGVNQGRVLVDVMTSSVMDEVVLYPELRPMSILTGIRWGCRPDGREIDVFLREAGALILGPPGSGKSTFVNGIIGGFAQCRDVLTWVIDLNAGSAGRPWVRPWLEATGRLAPVDGATPPAGTRPGVDWLASTPEEALLMLDAALAANRVRKGHYQRLMVEKDAELLPVSASLPQIEIIVDEGAELLSPRETMGDPVRKLVAARLLKVLRTTRAMGIRTVLTAVDGNVEALRSTEVRKYSPVHAVLTSAGGRENVDKLFGNLKVDVGQLSARGAGVIGARNAEGFAPTIFKTWLTTPRWVRDVVLATDTTRPVLDRPTARALGADYADRWSDERAGWLWADEAGPAGSAEVLPSPPPAPRPPTPGGLPPSLNLRAFRDRPDRPTPPPPVPPADRPRLNLSAFRRRDAEADSLVAKFSAEIDAQFGTTEEPPPPPPVPSVDEPAPRPDWVEDALAAIREAGPAGLGPQAVADAVRKNVKTVRGGLQALAAEGLLVYRDRGPRSVYVHPDHAAG